MNGIPAVGARQLEPRMDWPSNVSPSCLAPTRRDNPRRTGRHAASVTYVAVLLALAVAVGAAPITDWVSTIAVYAQAGGGYDLTWNTVDNSGTTFSSGGGYTLGGTAGQPDAAVWSGGGYTLSGGFWHAGAAGGTPPGGASSVYLPVILKNR